MADKKPKEKLVPGVNMIPSEKEDPLYKRDQEYLRKRIERELKDKKDSK